MTAHPLIRLKPKEGRRARAGAPWIFSNEIVIDATARGLAPGTLVHAEADDGRSFGTGYFNPKTLIAVRLFGSSVDVAVDRGFLAERLARALALRNRFYDRPYYRLVHAEGDGLPGAVIDRFGDTLVVQIATAGMEMLLESLLAAADEVLSPAAVVLRADSPYRALEELPAYVRTAKGSDTARLIVEENSARYFADIHGGQKTGWYYDQRDNRAFMARLSAEKSVFDAFCYTGGFAVAAARADAREVNGIDSSTAALTLAEESAAANGVAARCRFVKADAMEELERLCERGEKFDVVIADPPPFVPARKDLEAGARAYRKLARLAASVTRPGGFLLLASCSHNISAERFAQECATGIHRTGRRASLIRSAGAAPDHPVHPMLPETAYLKALIYALD